MIAFRPRAIRLASLLLAAGAVLLASPGTPGAIDLPGSLTLRAEGRAPVLDGRVDTAFQQALGEAFRRGLLDALRGIAPERQSPVDLETWQQTILSRAGDFVGAWRILSHEEKDGFVQVEAEVEVWRDKLARAAGAPGIRAAAPAVRLAVLADSLPLAQGADEEEVDVGRDVAVALESEFSRRGAVIISTSGPAPWEEADGPSTEENRIALATAVAKRLEADVVLIVQITRSGNDLFVVAQLVAVSSEATLGSARGRVSLLREGDNAESFSTAARQLTAALAPRLAGVRPRRTWGRAP